MFIFMCYSFHMKLMCILHLIIGNNCVSVSMCFRKQLAYQSLWISLALVSMCVFNEKSL